MLAGGTAVAVVMLSGKHVAKPNVEEKIPAFYQDYLAVKKDLYVWSHSIVNRLENADGSQSPAWHHLLKNTNSSFDNLLYFSRQHGFRRLFLFAGSVEWEYDDYFSQNVFPLETELISALQKAQKSNIEVELVVYLNDVVNNLTFWQGMDSVARAVQKLRIKSGIDTLKLHVDQEPSDPAKYEVLVKMLQSANAIVATSSTIKPLWLGQRMDDLKSYFSPEFLNEFGTLETFADVVGRAVTSTQVMAYSNDRQRVKYFGDTFQAVLNRTSRPGDVIVETGFVNDLSPTETLHYSFKSNPKQILSFITELSGQYNGIVVHDYAQFYFTMYCTDPQKITSFNTDYESAVTCNAGLGAEE